MAEKENISIARRLFTEVYTGGDASVLDSIVSSDVILNDPSAKGFKGGLKALKEREQMFLRAFPDKRATIEDLYAHGDIVVVRWSVTGTHKNELPGIPATNKTFTVTGISILKFKNGKIIEIYQNWDELGLLKQLGVQIPTALAGVR